MVREDSDFSALNVVVYTRIGLLTTRFEGFKDEKLVKGEFWGFFQVWGWVFLSRGSWRYIAA